MELSQQARDLITSGVLAHLATIDADGKPHVTCAWTGIEDGAIVIATLGDQRKLKNIRRDPRVTVSYETRKTNDWGLTEYLVIDGTAEITEGGAPELLQELAHVYLGPDVTFPPMPEPPPGFITRISPTKVSGVGPWA